MTQNCLKRQLRQAIVAKRALEDANSWHTKNAMIATKLLAHSKVCQARTLMLYHSLPDEVAMTPLLTEFYQSKTLLLPKVTYEGLTLHRYEGESSLERGAYHIQEPTTPLFEEWQMIDVMLVPGLAFDRLGHRLGRGKGYYDRLLASMEGRVGRLPYLIGVCFDFQMLDSVPRDAHDYDVDEVVFNA